MYREIHAKGKQQMVFIIIIIIIVKYQQYFIIGLTTEQNYLFLLQIHELCDITDHLPISKSSGPLLFSFVLVLFPLGYFLLLLFEMGSLSVVPADQISPGWF